MSGVSVEKTVLREVRARRLIEPGEPVLVALSGGPDSVALLSALKSLAGRRGCGWLLFAAHLNHRLRGRSSDRDERFCRRLCGELDVPFRSEAVDVRRIAGARGISIETAAREARRAFLVRAADGFGCATVAVAHQADDRIETLLFRLCRGTSAGGLSGIEWESPLRTGLRPIRLVRPLLSLFRSDLLEYLREKGRPFRRDATNRDLKIPRNYIRHRIIPALAGRVHPGTRLALWRLAESAGETSGREKRSRLSLFRACAGLGLCGELRLPVEAEGYDADDVRDALAVAREVWRVEGPPSSEDLRRLGALLRPGPAARLDLPGGLIAERGGRSVRIGPRR
ncbi:MAG: tRNA lysidine(34) synthetase TilS [Planctomycetota bacterium]|nr:tRNA lysidine(34) synthetase TilS [Planctomycetota bacterium]